MQCCLEILGQKLHKVFSYAMLTQEYLDNIAFDFFLCSVVRSLLGNIA